MTIVQTKKSCHAVQSLERRAEPIDDFWEVTIVPIVSGNASIRTTSMPQTRDKTKNKNNKTSNEIQGLFLVILLGNCPHLDFLSPTAASVPPKHHASIGVVGI